MLSSRSPTHGLFHLSSSGTYSTLSWEKLFFRVFKKQSSRLWKIFYWVTLYHHWLHCNLNSPPGFDQIDCVKPPGVLLTGMVESLERKKYSWKPSCCAHWDLNQGQRRIQLPWKTHLPSLSFLCHFVMSENWSLQFRAVVSFDKWQHIYNLVYLFVCYWALLCWNARYWVAYFGWSDSRL